MARQKARGKSEEGLGDFTFLYTVWFYCVHLLISINTLSKLEKALICSDCLDCQAIVKEKFKV
ncbi:hypothetical protein FJR39_17945 [Dolichospermum flos-aquae UHCC 0037]|uniref:Uncharacterized protein n=1 Tax=Dolichospermum flos-aquae UHCC 0037 TaxID=2590026 RepID=A0ACC7S954_DOLFA|nr:hypothetical protein [Dolichospermum flos-aquae UHCC 0037]